MKLYVKVLIGLTLGVLLGVLLREKAVVLEPVGDIFIRLLRMVIVPLVLASLVMGVVSIGSIRRLGRLGFKTALYYLSTTLLAVVTGLVLVNVMQPGVGTNLTLDYQSIPQFIEQEPMSLAEILTDIVPNNILAAMAEGKMLGIIFFALMVGAALAAIGQKGQGITRLFDSLNEVMLQISEWIMKLSPIGVAALMAVLIGRTGFAVFKPLLLYITTVLLGLGIHFFVTLTLFVITFAKISPVAFWRKMFPALATAFSTDSSVVTLPVTMECLEHRVGVSNKVTSFTAPLGATMNMDGTALYEAVAAMFIAQVYGIEISIVQQIIIVLTATLASIGAAGIPSAGLITMVIVLKSVNLPIEGLGLVLAVDRILDMCRTTVNVYGDACGAVIIANWEGEKIDLSRESE